LTVIDPGPAGRRAITRLDARDHVGAFRSRTRTRDWRRMRIIGPANASIGATANGTVLLGDMASVPVERALTDSTCAPHVSVAEGIETGARTESCAGRPLRGEAGSALRACAATTTAWMGHRQKRS
jgi:hypothetical protein